jgi:serine O-acetyltransferase
MIINLLVKLFGGFWKLKDLSATTKSGILGSVYSCVYKKYLQSMGSWISCDSQLPEGLSFLTGLNGIFISGSAKIERNCVIFQQVTIGSNILLDSKTLGAPTIEDDCYIGAGPKSWAKPK